MSYTLASEKVISKRMDAEVVIINLENGIYYSVEGIGAPLWEGLVSGATLADLSEEVRARYPSLADPAKSVGSFMDELLEAGLIIADQTSGSLPDTLTWPDEYTAAVLIAYEDISDMIALDPPLPELD